VTTVARPWTNIAAEGLDHLSQSFDQETAAVIIARQAVSKLENEDPYDVLRWIDRNLIRLVAKYASYQKGDPSSLALGQQFVLFPQFMYHLRRSHFLQINNLSPDEEVFVRGALQSESVQNALIMIQPMLESYEVADPSPKSVLLSASSVDSSKILVLDTFFLVLIFLGHDVVQARKEGLAEKPEGEAFRAFLAAPVEDAKALLKDRFPYPRYIECAQFSGDARHLLSIIDPNITHNTASRGVGEAVLTDDVSLQVFVEHLKRAAVQQED
jgi:protein transport protein SEC23